MIIFVRRTPVFFSSKRQDAIETSTYGAEFCAMISAVEGTIAIRYMLRCVGVKMVHSYVLLGDNPRVVRNASIPDSKLKKKHVAPYHRSH